MGAPRAGGSNPGRARPVPFWRSGGALRVGLTVLVVYGLHFATNVVRETYLAIAVAEDFSLRVDPYEGLHPDLFRIEGRGVFINNNPGASLLGAVPYLLARPAIALLFEARPGLAEPKPQAGYDDPRPNRVEFYNAARARGLDIKLGLAAAVTHVGLMVPLGALAAMILFVFLRGRLGSRRLAAGLALLYALGTPIFFRSGYLNQNAIVAHAVLMAYVAMAGSRPLRSRDGAAPARLVGVGALLGLAVLCDYSGVPLIVAFGLWSVTEGAGGDGVAGGIRSGAWYSLGAAGPLVLLLAYQFLAFGDPFLPAQAYMPDTAYSVSGWHGLSLPAPQLLWRNLVSPHYGLLAFSPMLAAAVFAPFLDRRPGGPSRGELVFIFGASVGLYLFNSANQFAHLQWNTGVRYMVPAAPLLFIALVPVLLSVGRIVLAVLVVPTVVISWSVAMVREDVRSAVSRVFTEGPSLPWITTLAKTGAAERIPLLETPVPAIALFVGAGVVLAGVWSGWMWDGEGADV